MLFGGSSLLTTKGQAMTRILSAILALLIGAACGAAPDDSVALAVDGKPTSVIVIADEPSAAARRGAEDLRMWLEKMSGATVPVVAESKVAADNKAALILVGDTQRTRALGIEADKFDLEEFVVRTFPGVLVLAGDDKRPDGVVLAGTQLAVDAFAEDVLGIRVLWPGELGQVVPAQSTIRVSDLNIRQKPVLRERVLRNLKTSRWVSGRGAELGWVPEAYGEFFAEGELWFRFHRLGGSFKGHFGHAFGSFWKRFGKEHPEWFALRRDGTRDWSARGGRALLCVSNPELQAQVAKDCIARFRRNPTLNVVSISPNDNHNGFCLCDNCEAMDAPGAKIITYWGSTIQHVSLSDRYAKYFSAVATIVAKEFPDRYLGAYAYSAYLLGPVRAKLHPNVIIGFVQRRTAYLNDAEREDNLENWRTWAKQSTHLLLRPNILMAARPFPSVYVHKLGEDTRFFADNKLLLANHDCCYQHWGTNGLNYYVLAKLLWDPKREVDEIVDDYCAAGFGPAAKAVRRYFDRLEAITNEIAAGRDVIQFTWGKRKNPELVAKRYTDEVLAELHGLLDQAVKQAGADERVKERVAFLRLGLEYVPLSRDYIFAKKQAESGDVDDLKRVAELRQARIAWFQQKGFTWAVNAPSLMNYDY